MGTYTSEYTGEQIDSNIKKIAALNEVASKQDINEINQALDKKAEKTEIPTVPTKVSELTNDSGFITGYTETDPVYTADKPNIALKSEIPTKVSDLTNDSNYLTSIPSEYVTETELNGKGYLTSYTETDPKYTADKDKLALKTEIPTKVSDLTNDKNYLTSYTETDPTVPSWAKTTTKPSYTKTEVGLGNVDNVKQYSASNPPPYPVTSVNGKTGAVTIDTSTELPIPSHWEAPVNECIAKIKALQVNRNCVTFPFFSDNHTRDGAPQYMGMLIAKVMEECGIPYCFCGGDAISSAIAPTVDGDRDFREQAKAFKEAMSYIPEGRFCMALGNHESFLAKNPNIEGSVRVDYDRNQTYEIFLRDKGVTQNKHFGGDGTYYYVDDLPSKVRWIILNTNGIGNTNIDDVQLDWFENVALKFNESGWGVVIISHIPITNHYAQSDIGNAEAVVRKLKYYMASEDENKADIIGWYSGHIHRDRIYEGMSINDTDSSESDEKMGFKQVTITSDHTLIAYKNDDGTTSSTYHPVQYCSCKDANGNSICVKNHAIDFVTINKDRKIVTITRLGIGSDVVREYSYSNEAPVEPTVTNFADISPTSETPTLTYGWLTDYRLNSTNVTQLTNANFVVTNMIDTNGGDKVYVYGLDMSHTSAAYSYYLQNIPKTSDGTSLQNNSRYADQASKYNSDLGCYVFDGFSGWVRFCGVPKNGAENVVINIERNGVLL